MFTFDQLAGFIAVAEELHFGRAAERLNMTQPPLSRQIQKLEKSIGTELLERDNRKVQLTAAGRAFLDEARRLMALADRAPVTARRIASGRSGLLRIGFTAASGFSILGPLLEEIAAIVPDVDIDLQELVTGEQIQGLLTGELDLGLARPPFDTGNLRFPPAVPRSHGAGGARRPPARGALPAHRGRGPQGRAAHHALAHQGHATSTTSWSGCSPSSTQTWSTPSARSSPWCPWWRPGAAWPSCPHSATLLGIKGVEFLPLAGRRAKSPWSCTPSGTARSTNPALAGCCRTWSSATE